MQLRVLAAGIILLALFTVTPALLSAQEPHDPIAGVTGGPIGQGQPDIAPGHILSLRRVVFEQGGYVSTHHHSGPLVLYVESGALHYRVVEGEAEIFRGELFKAGAGTPVPSDRLGPGDEAVLEAGNWLYEAGLVHSVRNEGSKPAVVWLSALWAADQPSTIFHEEATPAP